MATVAEVNKAEEVRTYIKANRKAKPKEVSEALKEKGIDVTPAHVSNIKFQMKAAKKARAVTKAETAKNGAAVAMNGQADAAKGTRKGTMKMRRRRKAKAVAAAVPESISLNALIAAKEVVVKLGSIKAVKEAVAAFEKLGG